MTTPAPTATVPPTAYPSQRVNVINAIYSANLERLRAFSDAFKLMKP